MSIQELSEPGSMTISLHAGEKLFIRKISGGGYVAAPMGAYILSNGRVVSRDLVGKYTIVVEYDDGETGLIAQEEILEVVNSKGEKVPFGNSSFPGHPEYDKSQNFSHQDYLFNYFLKVMSTRDSFKNKGKNHDLKKDKKDDDWYNGLF